MRGRRTLATALTLAAIFLFAGWSGAVSGGGAQETPEGQASLQTAPAGDPVTTGFAVGDTASSLSWDTTATGNRHLRLTFDFGTVQQCTFRFTAEGVTAAGRPHFFYAGHDTPGKLWGKLEYIDLVNAPYTTHAHVANLAVTDVEGSGQWYGIMAFTAVVSGEESWMFSGYNLRPSTVIPTAPQRSITIDVDCDNTFTVTRIEAGVHGLTYNPPKMRGGVGASQGLGPDTAINVQDVIPASFSGGHVYYRYRSHEDVSLGVLEVDSPSNPASILLTGDDDIFTDGPAGRWDTRFTRTAYGEGQVTVGVVVALADVASLDAAAAL